MKTRPITHAAIPMTALPYRRPDGDLAEGTSSITGLSMVAELIAPPRR